MTPRLRKGRGESFDDSSHVFDEQSELTRSRVISPWFAKDGDTANLASTFI